MPFVKRGPDGKITAVFNEAVQDGSEEIHPDAPELSEFLLTSHPEAAAKRDLIESDLGLARVLEDLIDVLIERGTFQFSDLPEAAQRKLMARRGLRKEFAYMDSLFSLEESDFIPDDSEDGEGFL